MYFEVDDSTSAEIFVNKTSHLIYKEGILRESLLRYKRANLKV